MTVTKNIAKAIAVAIFARRFWNGQNLFTKFYAEESKKECFELMISTLPDAIADIIECHEVGINRRARIMDALLLWTNAKNAEDTMLSIVDTLHNKFSYDI